MPMGKFIAGAILGVAAVVAYFSCVTASGEKVVTVSNEGIKIDRNPGDEPDVPAEHTSVEETPAASDTAQ